MTDEPLGAHVLEFELTDVVDENADARSLTFRVPAELDIPAEKLRNAPGQFLTLRVPAIAPVPSPGVIRCPARHMWVTRSP